MPSKKTRKIIRSGLALVATTIAEAAIQEAAENPRVQRTAKDVAASTGRALKRTAKKLSKRSRKVGSKGRSAVRRKKAGAKS